MDLNRQDSNKDIYMVNKQIRGFSILLAIQERKITRMRYHFASTRMAIIKKTAKCGQECGEIRVLLHSLWEYEILLLLWENNLEVPKQTKHRVASRYIPKRNESLCPSETFLVH